MKRCLIIGCSEAKLDTPGEISALERYDGPPFRVLRRFLKQHSDHGLDVLVLSAEFGLIKGEQPIPVYDRRMTEPRAAMLRPQVLERFRGQVADQVYNELFLSMGRTYLLALNGYEALLPPMTKVIVSAVTAGRKLTELKAWLTGDNSETAVAQAVRPGQPRRRANQPIKLRGVELALTPDQVLAQVRQALAAVPEQAGRVKDWYVCLDGVKVAPKWLVSYLTGVPVSQFDASEARRVLEALGVAIHKMSG